MTLIAIPPRALKLPTTLHHIGFECLYEVVEYDICEVFMKAAFVSERPQVKF